MLLLIPLIIVLVICWPLIKHGLSLVRFMLVGFALLSLYAWITMPS